MDDDWGYPYFRKPPFLVAHISNMNIMVEARVLVVNYCDCSNVRCCLDILFPRPNGYGLKHSYLRIETAGNKWDIWMSISPKDVFFAHSFTLHPYIVYKIANITY